MLPTVPGNISPPTLLFNPTLVKSELFQSKPNKERILSRNNRCKLTFYEMDILLKAYHNN
jgi:hypothetical protein